MLFDFFREKEPTVNLEELREIHPAIRVQNLHKTYLKKIKGSGRKKEEMKITALEDLSFTVESGQILGLLGPNSSGKTTTLRCMSTLTSPDSGNIDYYGVSALTSSRTVRSMLGFVMQSAGMDKVLTGREHLDLFADLAHLDRDEKAQSIACLIDLLGLEEFIDRQAGVYSGGVVRRLDLAIALLHRPPILILDEPTVGLDVESRRVIWDTLRNWRDQGGSIIFSSHYLEEVDVLADQVVIMEKGVMIASGTTTELKDGLGGDRVTVKLDEFTDGGSAESALLELKRRDLILDGIVNRLQNNSIELVVSPDNAAIGSEIVRTLADMGHDRLFSFSQSKPSLDDVYLAATGKSLMDADMIAKSGRTEKSIRQESMA